MQDCYSFSVLSKFVGQLNRWYFGKPQGGFLAPKQLRGLSAWEQNVADEFHKIYYASWVNGRRSIDVSWLGRKAWKCPLDLWTYQEIIYETRPDLIIECGTHEGGSAYFLATICQLLGHGRVITIDIESQPSLPKHPLLKYIRGSSIDPAIVEKIRRLAKNKSALVILDSDHRKPHVLAEMSAYSSMVTPGNYLIVEDTNINGHPALPGFGPGPMEAVGEFLASHPEFQIDLDRERFMMTLNPNGFLKRLG